ncbi:MAG: hypothetical protein ACYTAS_19150 [Planctomycetota bacterium]|jgi:hypothetical protein
MKSITSIYREDADGNEIEVVVEFEFQPGKEPHFDRDFGNWLPADPPHFKVLKAEAYTVMPDNSIKVEPVNALTEGEIETILVELEPCEEAEYYADEKYDQRRDDELTGDYDRFAIYDQ